MLNYELFGGVLQSDLELPELRVAERCTAPTWRFTEVEALPEVATSARLRSESIADGVNVTLCRESDGYRLHFDDTGAFSVSMDGTRIRWVPPTGVRAGDVRTDLLGRVFALALHQMGALALHGSGVAFEGGVIVFLAPKRHGKSTTALALVDAGARLVGDDMIIVQTDTPPTVLPGIASAKLWPDSAMRLTLGQEAIVRDTEQPKLVLDGIPAARMLDRALPLLACYLLAPQQTIGGDIKRTRLYGLPAALALMGQAKIGGLLAGPLAARLLDMSVCVAGAAPVYRLSLPRALDRLPDVAKHIMAWHDRTGCVRQ